MTRVGYIFVVVGLVWCWFAFSADATVRSEEKYIGNIHVPSARVHNIGLMEDRRNHLLLAGLTILVGVLLVGFGSLQKPKDHSETRDSSYVPHAFPEIGASHFYPGAGQTMNSIRDLQEIGYVVSESGDRWAIEDPGTKSISYAWSPADLEKIAASCKERHAGKVKVTEVG